MELTAVLTPAEEGGYIALNPETGTLQGLPSTSIGCSEFLLVKPAVWFSAVPVRLRT
jgi:hypothetical protein